MESVWTDPPNKPPMDPEWGKMLGISLFLHVVIFCGLLFFQGSPSLHPMGRPVYVVDLVELPGPVRSGNRPGVQVKKAGRRRSSGKTASTRRIREVRERKRAVVIARRTIRRKQRKVRKRPVSASRMIDRAVSKIKEQVRKEKANPIDQAIAGISARIKAAGAGRRPENGIIIDIYKQEVEDWIKQHWSYAVDLAAPDRRTGLKAVVVVKAERTGKILDSWLKKRSGVPLFDHSALRAVERSNPLPPFPGGYAAIVDEFEITFDLSDLEPR